ncbi:hypothetical protein [Streptomyces sp. NPDC054838]
MLKFGTGSITVPSDQEDVPAAISRTASALTEEERAALLAEGEADQGE